MWTWTAGETMKMWRFPWTDLLPEDGIDFRDNLYLHLNYKYMKKFYLIAGALAVLLSSCAKTEVVSVSDGNLIGFGNAFVGNPTKAGLPSEDQYGASKLPPQFFAYANTDASTVVFAGEKVYQSNDSWVYDNLKKWESGKTYKFAAYAVKDGTGLPSENGTASFDYATHTLKITGYTSNDNYQTDLLMAASSQTLADANEPVKFSFKHALSMIKFTLKSGFAEIYPVTISNFKVEGMSTKGDVSLVQGGDIAWTNQAAESPAVPFTDNTWTADATNSTPAVSDEFVVIPQDNATIKVTFDVVVNGDPAETLTSTISAQNWKPGNRYNYVATITPGDLDYIEFSEPEVDEWGGYTDVDADID